MNNKPNENEARPPMDTLRMRLARIGKATWKLLSKNFGLKVLSLLLAILLWNYVISTNTSITRTKTLNGLTGYVTGQSTLRIRAALRDQR